jgi:hypothetical protein
MYFKMSQAFVGSVMQQLVMVDVGVQKNVLIGAKNEN